MSTERPADRPVPARRVQTQTLLCQECGRVNYTIVELNEWNRFDCICGRTSFDLFWNGAKTEKRTYVQGRLL